MRKYLLSLPFAVLGATFAFMYFNMSESDGVPLNSDDESIIGTLFWCSFIACQRTIPIISKRSMLWVTWPFRFLTFSSFLRALCFEDRDNEYFA